MKMINLLVARCVEKKQLRGWSQADEQIEFGQSVLFISFFSLIICMLRYIPLAVDWETDRRTPNVACTSNEFDEVFKERELWQDILTRTGVLDAISCIIFEDIILLVCEKSEAW